MFFWITSSKYAEISIGIKLYCATLKISLVNLVKKSNESSSSGILDKGSKFLVGSTSVVLSYFFIYFDFTKI